MVVLTKCSGDVAGGGWMGVIYRPLLPNGLPEGTFCYYTLFFKLSRYLCNNGGGCDMSPRVFVLLSNFLNFARRDSLFEIQYAHAYYITILCRPRVQAAFTHNVTHIYTVKRGKKSDEKTLEWVGRYIHYIRSRVPRGV